MISHITIRDFAIIENVSLDFHEGFHILTGETGAGKSILIEAISLALGSRADTAYVRTGADKAVIELIVETKDPEVLNLLSSNGIDDGETIYITREIHAAGKSVCRINGSLVSVSFLNELCKNIADIHGQYDHQSLLNPAYHIELIDRYDSKTIDPIKEKVKNAYELYIQTKQKLDSIVKKHAEYQRKLDFMKYELDEIVAADPKIGEDEKLAEKMQLLQNSEMIFEKLATAYEILYEQTPSCQDSLGKASNLLQEIQSFSGDINSIAEAISDCYYKLEDLKKYLRLQRDSISFSPDLLDETIERIDLLDRLKRKYGGSIEKVLNYKQELVENLKDIENSDELIEKLNKALVEYKNQLMEASQELTSKRKQVASELETKINKELN
ncbi:MAG: AAA family ATPase, partial [Clostridiales bacterium]|nr:AAA family ATPase [Clostridiales bacterium]